MQILDVKNEKDWADFLALPGVVYKNDPYYRPTNPRNEIEMLIKENPAVRVLLIKDVARMVLIPSQDVGKIGYFEAVNDLDAVKMLFNEAINYFKRMGVRSIIGPMNNDTWHSYRFNLGPYTQPFLFEPYNPSYYPALWEGYGFVGVADYYSRCIEDISAMPSKLEEKYHGAIAKGFKFRTFESESFDNDLKIIYDISCKAFVDNFLYTEISFEDFYALYEPAKKIIVPQLIVFVMDANNEPVGFFFGIPNDKKTFNGKTVAIVPGYRQYGLASAMQYLVYQNALKMGFSKANLCLIHQGNPSDKINKELGNITRTYRLYEYGIKL